jgi:hypothetical protein
MSKRFLAICLSVVVTIVLLAVLFPGCDGGVDGGQYTIKVSATLCGEEWPGDLAYNLTCDGEDTIYGDHVPASHVVGPGNWTIEVSDVLVDVFVDDEDELTCVFVGDLIPLGELNITLEKNQDASIGFINWTIDGVPFEGSWEIVDTCQVIDVHFLQGVVGCSAYNVTLNETSWLSITQNYGAPAQIFVVNASCAVNKTPLLIEPVGPLADVLGLNWTELLVGPPPPVKLAQVPSINNLTVQAGSNMTLVFNKTMLLDVHTQWQLVKWAFYEKSINWLGISVGVPEPGHNCTLFELVVPGSGNYSFKLQAFAYVALVNATDVDPTYDWATSTILSIGVTVP